MTTLSDLLNDFAEDIKKDLGQEDILSWEDIKEERIYEYLETIKARLIG